MRFRPVSTLSALILGFLVSPGALAQDDEPVPGLPPRVQPEAEPGTNAPPKVEIDPNIVSSETHPVLKRALTERPESDVDKNGILTLEEYNALQPKHERQHNPQGPPAMLPVLENGAVVVADFENNNFRDRYQWKPEGNAFTRDLNAGTKLMKRRVGSYDGKFFLTSIQPHNQNEQNGVGKLTSPEIPLELDFLVMTMSGGDLPQQVAINLWVGDQLVRTASGSNDDYFEDIAFDLREFRGQRGRVELRDSSRGLWGHLNVDRILLTNAPGKARQIAVRPEPIETQDGLVLTTKGPLSGTLAVKDGSVLSKEQPVPFADILLALNPRRTATASKGAIRLIDGEIWQAEIRGVEKDKVTIHNPFFGAREVPLKRIASLEFQTSDDSAAREPGHLYRTDGEPIPGKLVWVRPKDIAVDCPLGIIPIKRELVQRFVFEAVRPVTQSADAIGLMDGTLLYGTASLAGAQLAVTHPVLGELKINWDSVHYVRRHREGLYWIDQLKQSVVESIGPALPPPPPTTFSALDDSHLRALRIMPHTVFKITLPPAAGTLRARLVPVPGSRANLKVTLLAGERAVWTKEVPANSKAISLSADVSNAKDLFLRVEFAGPLAFPCGIDLRDAHVLTGALTKTPEPENTNQEN